MQAGTPSRGAPDTLAPDCDAGPVNLPLDDPGTPEQENVYSYTCEMTISQTADFVNVADVVGTPPTGPDVSDEDNAPVDIIHPAIDIQKTVYDDDDDDDEDSCPGDDLVKEDYDDEVTYCFVVTNAGDTYLTDVVVDDPDLGISLPVPGPLAPYGGTATVSYEATIDGDLTNTATASGTPSDGGATSFPTSPASATGISLAWRRVPSR